MAYYLVRAVPKRDLLETLEKRLENTDWDNVKPFGKALHHAITNARMDDDGTAVWEEEDYCSPPLAQERAHTLDEFFDNLEVEAVKEGEGWKQIEGLPRLFPAES